MAVVDAVVGDAKGTQVHCVPATAQAAIRAISVATTRVHRTTTIRSTEDRPLVPFGVTDQLCSEASQRRLNAFRPAAKHAEDTAVHTARAATNQRPAAHAATTKQPWPPHDLHWSCGGFCARKC